MRDITPSDQDSEPTAPGHQVLLSAGAKTNITVDVTAEDGTTTDTYTVTIYRLRRVASDDADLSALSLSSVTLSPSFASGKDAYTARVPYGTDKITVSYTADVGAAVAISAAPFPTDSSATADADGDTPGHQVALVAGGTNTVITVTVTAEDDMAREDPYIVTVYRENLVKSDDPSLATLTLSDGTPGGNTPITFTYDPSSADKSYDVRVPTGVRAVTVAATTTHPGAVAVVTPSDQDSLTTLHQVLLSAGAKTDITIEVTAEDGTTTDTYTVTIYRLRRVASDDADLSALSLSSVTLSPSFASGKDAYTARVPYGTDKITVSYTADVGAAVAISAAPFPTDSSATADADGDTPGHQVALVAGGTNTVITVTVTAEDDMARKTPTLLPFTARTCRRPTTPACMKTRLARTLV